MYHEALIEAGSSLLERGRSFLHNKLAIASMAGIAAASLVGGIANAGNEKQAEGAKISYASYPSDLVINPTFSFLSLIEQQAASDLEGPHDVIVCAFPKGQSCNISRAQETFDGIQAFTGSATTGANGLSVRLNPDIKTLELGIDTTEIERRAMISANDPNAKDNLQDYITSEVQTKIGNSPSISYDVVLTNTPDLGSQGNSCSPGFIWNGMNTPLNGVNRNVTVTYATDSCSKGDKNGNPFHGYKSEAVFALAAKIHNEGFLQPCNDTFIGSPASVIGFSSASNDIEGLSAKQNWFGVKIGNYILSASGCSGLDANIRMDWQYSATTNGNGGFETYVKDGSGNWIPRPLDPGSRVEAGTPYEVRYNGNENVVNWTGCIADGKNSCTFTATNIIDIHANVKSSVSDKKYRVTVVKSKGVKVTGNGISCPPDCSEVLASGTLENLTAKATIKGMKPLWEKCGGNVVGAVCKLVMNGNKQAMAVAKHI